MVDSRRASRRPAFYAAGPGRLGDWWTVLHPPYTAWHLSYVVIGACLAPHVNVGRLAATLAGFFLAVGVAAHALDELHGRPLRTGISTGALWTAVVVGVGGAVGLGAAGVVVVGPALVGFVVVGPLLVVAYNAELFGGALHSDTAFAAAWGSFPVLAAYAAQAGTLAAAPAIAAVAAFVLSAAQRQLSTPARRIRRSVVELAGSARFADGSVRAVDASWVLGPVEGALRRLSWAVVLVAAAFAVARLT